jgi:hypothetical protein
MMAGGDVTIIAGGWSVRDVRLDRLAGVVIAVNDSAIYAPRWNYAVSMDRLWTENRIDQLARVVEAEPSPQQVWIRRNALQNLPSTAGLLWLYPFECDHKSTYFATTPEVLNGTNSGACALNLAWKLNPARLFLLGFDMNRDERGRAYWYPPYPWSSTEGSTTRGKYDVWAKQFATAAMLFKRIGCKVFNVSPTSSINTFPKISPANYLELTA